MKPLKNCLGIVRETFNVWERRAPLTPAHVQQLIAQGVKVLIQPSDSRVFPIQAYEEAGAEVREDLSEASVIVGVKQVPPAELIPHRVYSFFSHTIKAQTDNMPLLDTILEKNVQLVDYEMLINEKGDRVASPFSKWAGRVGTLDIMHGLGLRLVALGFNTPFLYVGLAHNYRNMTEVEASLKLVHNDLAKHHLPKGLCPMVIVVTGCGNVSKGVQEILRLLPHDYILVKSLPEVVANATSDKIYICVCNEEDHLERKDGVPFTMDDYIKHPHMYHSLFASKVAPYASLIINCIVWLPGQPRFLTNQDTPRVLSLGQSTQPVISGRARVPHRLLAVSDISADPGGSLEFVSKCTTIDKPFFIHRENPASDTDRFDVPDGVLVCSVENMPSQMPGAAASDFSDLFISCIPSIMKADASVGFENQDLAEWLRDATMTSNGKLTPKFEYIAELRKQKGV